MSNKDARMIAALLIKEVMVKKQSLDKSFTAYKSQLSPSDASLCKALCFGVLRYFESLNQSLMPLLDKPLRNKDYDVYALLLIGAYQLYYMRTPEYAAIDSVVSACKQLKKPWGAGLINAVLRKLQKSQSEPLPHHQHPAWLAGKIQKAWPLQSEAIFAAHQHEPPLCIRVNCQKISRTDYLQLLLDNQFDARIGQLSESAIYIHNKPSDIFQLPGFADGLCSVQDEAAQMAAFLLPIAPKMRILDACSAPGGKTCHLLERLNNQADLLALDIDSERLKRVDENLQRLQLHADLKAGDIQTPNSWWDGALFDAILCDAPCSGTGVIRRHPDIKYLRSFEDIKALAAQQKNILKTLWPLLKTDGYLLYATCSIMPDENSQVIEQFCQTQKDCQLQSLNRPSPSIGWQLFPAPDANDGFYYALLKKMADA